MPRRLAVELAELRQILLAHIVSRQVQHGILQSARMSIAQDESIAIDPRGILRRVVHDFGPQQVRHGSASHGRAGMARTGSLRLVRRDETNRIHALGFQTVAHLDCVLQCVLL